MNPVVKMSIEIDFFIVSISNIFWLLHRDFDNLAEGKNNLLTKSLPKRDGHENPAFGAESVRALGFSRFLLHFLPPKSGKREKKFSVEKSSSEFPE